MTPSLTTRISRALQCLRGHRIVTAEQDARELRAELAELARNLSGASMDVHRAVAAIRGPTAQLLSFADFKNGQDELNRLTVYLRERGLLGTGIAPVSVAIRLIEGAAQKGES